MVEVGLGDSKVLRTSVWKSKCDGKNPCQTQIGSKIQNLLH